MGEKQSDDPRKSAKELAAEMERWDEEEVRRYKILAVMSVFMFGKMVAAGIFTEEEKTAIEEILVDDDLLDAACEKPRAAD